MVILAGQNVNVTRLDVLTVQAEADRGECGRGSKDQGLECPHPKYWGFTKF